LSIRRVRAEAGGGDDARRAGDTVQRLQALGIDHREVFDEVEPAVAQRLRRRRRSFGARLLSVANRVGDRDELPVHDQRLGAFLGAHVAVARRHREPVGLAHRRHAHDLERHGEVAHHALDDLELLVVLFAEVGAVGHRHQQELTHHRGDPLEMAGPQRTAQSVGDARDGHSRELLTGIHLVLGRREDDAALRGAQLVEVALLVARIGGEILLRAELRRIDEDARHRNVAAIERALHQADMAFMQRAHRRHQPDGAARLPEAGDGTAQVRHRADDEKARVFDRVA
jgi:hypothetical protein